MKSWTDKKKQVKIKWMVAGMLLLVLGVGLYAVRNTVLDSQWWQYDDPEITDEEQQFNLGLGEATLEINQIQPGRSSFGSGQPFNCSLATPQWPSDPTKKGNDRLKACETNVATQGECVNMVVAQGGDGGGSCQQIRRNIPEEFGVSTAGASRGACVGVARMNASWKKALPSSACQPGLLFNQLSITSDVNTDRYTGATKEKGYINIDNMHMCMPGLTGRKHPVATKGSEVINLDPGKPHQTNAYSDNPGTSKLPEKGLQANLDAYRADGYTVTWEEYHTSPKGACECITERPAIVEAGGKFTVYCAKAGSAQVQIEGSTACAKNNKPVFCCPAGKRIQDNKCV